MAVLGVSADTTTVKASEEEDERRKNEWRNWKWKKGGGGEDVEIT